MEKRGDLTSNSHSDFDTAKKARYVDPLSGAVAGDGEKHLLRQAEKLAFDNTKDKCQQTK